MDLRKSPARSAAIVLLVAAALRVPLLIAVHRDGHRAIAPDSRDYLVLARELRTSGRFARPDGQPEVYRTPGYPAFLAAVGVQREKDAFRAVVIQMLADVFLCLLAGMFAVRLRSTTGMALPHVGVAAGLFQALSVVSAVYAARVLSDSLFALLLLCAAWMTLEVLQRPARTADSGAAPPGGGPPSLAFLAVWAAVLGLLPLWRAVALPFVLVHPPALALLHRRRAAWIAGIAILMIDGGWVLRNMRTAQYPGFSAVAALNLYRYEAAAVYARLEQRPFADVQSEFDERLYAVSSWPARARFARREAWTVLARHPVLWVRIHLQAAIASFLPAAGGYLQTCGFPLGGGTLAVLHDRGIAAAVRHFFRGRTWLLLPALLLCLPLMVRYGTSPVGFLRMMRTPEARRAAVYMAAGTAWFLLAPGPAAHPRFRTPVEPLLAVFAAVGVAAAISRFGALSGKRPPARATPAPPAPGAGRARDGSPG